MKVLLAELGYDPGLRGRLAVAALVAGGIPVAWLLNDFLSLLADVSPLAVHTGLWLVWFAWLGWWLPTRRLARLRSDPARAYRAAFLPDILPGVWLGFGQLSLPLVQTLRAPSGASIAWIGAGAVGIGVCLLVLAHRASDPASTLFVYEYRPSQPRITSRGIYAAIRHPMFLGAVIVSLGCGAIGGGVALWMGLVNLLALPVYGLVEDRRLSLVFGADFAEYRRAVGGFLPRPRRRRA